MLLGYKKEIADEIVALLSEGSLTTLELQAKIKSSKKITKQGFYKALQELITNEIVIKNKQIILLNSTWINKLQLFISKINENYSTELSNTLINLSEGESLVYYFTSLVSLDTFWKHYFLIIARNGNYENIVFYNPHEFWSLFVFESENFMYEWISINKKIAYEIIGNNTQLDRVTTQHIKKYGINIAYEPKPSYKNNVFPAVIGDYIIETVLDKKTANAIDNIYRENNMWNAKLDTQLNLILKNISRSKVVISRNSKRANSIRTKLLKKYFIF